MTIALITLSSQGAFLAHKLADSFEDARIFIHSHVEKEFMLEATPFEKIGELTREIFPVYKKLVYIVPCGVVVRSIAPLVHHKTTDPAVVVVDVNGRYAISLLSGHEGGANELALEVANQIGAEPIVTTTTEALKTLIIGIGCRRGVEASHILSIIGQTMNREGLSLEDVRLIASVDIKKDEKGLVEASKKLGIPLRFIPSTLIRSYAKAFESSDVVQKNLGLPAVAEPCAMLAGRRTSLILPKTIMKGVTIAVAVENSMSSE